MNDVLMQVLAIATGVVIAGWLVLVHVAAVMERKELKNRCDDYKKWFEQTRKESEE